MEFKQGFLRPFNMGDVEDLASAANNRKIWLNVRDEFPHPYRLEDAEAWVMALSEMDPPKKFAIVIEGRVRGGIGFNERPGKNYTHSLELGYWLAEDWWGRGIMSEAVRVVLDYAFQQLGVDRIFASAFEYNLASMRILEKNGFKAEGVARGAVMKEGKRIDEYKYGILREEFNSH